MTNCSIGRSCKISGEITNTIFLAYSNKQHSGFVGHSYIGEWVNLGALTTTSNLKNNYSLIRIKLNKSEIDTNCLFLGSLIGDHCKFAIGSKLSTGSVFGVGCNLFESTTLPKIVEPFSWLGDNKKLKYKWDQFVHTTQIIMFRRDQKLTEVQKELLENIYNN